MIEQHQNPDPTITADIETYIGDIDLSIAVYTAIPTSFSYDAAEPLAVKANLSTEGTVSTWVLSRDLLHAGLDGVAGMGEVVVFPSSFQENTGFTAIQLKPSNVSPEEHVTLFARTDEVADFIAKTLKLVPLGDETVATEAAIDNALAQILEEA